MQITITWEGVDEFYSDLNNIKEAYENILEGLKEAVDNVILPRVQSESRTVWNVRTGFYFTNWYTYTESPATVVVTNSAPYADPLEYGWTTRGGRVISSPGVLEPTVYEHTEDVREFLVKWLSNRIKVTQITMD